jgi:hypothetical protein
MMGTKEGAVVTLTRPAATLSHLMGEGYFRGSD